jgi:hypothetical protein
MVAAAVATHLRLQALAASKSRDMAASYAREFLVSKVSMNDFSPSTQINKKKQKKYCRGYFAF